MECKTTMLLKYNSIIVILIPTVKTTFKFQKKVYFKFDKVYNPAFIFLQNFVEYMVYTVWYVLL